MPRSLLLVPPVPELFAGATPIAPGYPRSYTPAQMRSWAAAAERMDRVVDGDRTLPRGERRLDRWLATPRDQLPVEAREVVDVHRVLMGGADTGITATLREDGKLDLAGGRHRAHYMLERGGAPIPVWVSCSDPDRLEQYRTRCDAEVARRREEDRARRTAVAPRAGGLAVERPAPARTVERSRGR